MNEQVKKYGTRFLSRVWIILLLAALSAGGVYFSYDKMHEKMYEAKFKLIITVSDSSISGVNVFDSLRSSQMAVGDICQIITSDIILANVEKDIGISQATINKSLHINAIPNTRVIEISSRMNSPAFALRLIQSLDKNLREKLLEVDKSITYRILSKPYCDPIPVNRSNPFIYSAIAALGGIILGGLINLVLEEMNLRTKNLYYIKSLFEEENILPIPVSKISNFEGGTL